jgi:hypothetical protein
VLWVEGQKTLGNWSTTLLNPYGNPSEYGGDLDLKMRRNQLDQPGPSRQALA